MYRDSDTVAREQKTARLEVVGALVVLTIAVLLSWLLWPTPPETTEEVVSRILAEYTLTQSQVVSLSSFLTDLQTHRSIEPMEIEMLIRRYLDGKPQY